MAESEKELSRVAAAFSSYDGDLSLPLGLALGSPIFPSGCEGKLGVALESLQGICISEVIDISLGNLDSSLCFFQPSISHDVLCM